MNEMLHDIITESNYKLTQFSQTGIDEIGKRLSIRKNKQGKDIVYVKCLVRNKEIKLTPEELVRQLYIHKLVTEYGYPIERMELERAISFGREKNVQI